MLQDDTFLGTSVDICGATLPKPRVSDVVLGIFCTEIVIFWVVAAGVISVVVSHFDSILKPHDGIKCVCV